MFYRLRIFIRIFLFLFYAFYCNTLLSHLARTNAMWGEFCVGFVSPLSTISGIEPGVFLTENLNIYLFLLLFSQILLWAKLGGLQIKIRKSQIRKCADLYNLLHLRTNHKRGTLRIYDLRTQSILAICGLKTSASLHIFSSYKAQKLF